jgi:hypothetical protein
MVPLSFFAAGVIALAVSVMSAKLRGPEIQAFAITPPAGVSRREGIPLRTKIVVSQVATVAALPVGLMLIAAGFRSASLESQQALQAFIDNSVETVGQVESARIVRRSRSRRHLIGYRYQDSVGLQHASGDVGSRIRFDSYRRSLEVPVVYSKVRPRMSRPISRSQAMAELREERSMGRLLPGGLFVVGAVLSALFARGLFMDLRRPRTGRVVEGEILALHASRLFGTRALVAVEDGSGARTFYATIADAERGHKVPVVVDESDAKLMAVCEVANPAPDDRWAQRQFP